jgi:hypothetical protein
MLDKNQAQTMLEYAVPDSPPQVWTKYNDLYLFRVEFPMSGEEIWDTFFSVDSNTGEVKDFSVLKDADISEIAALDWQEI